MLEVRTDRYEVGGWRFVNDAWVGGDVFVLHRDDSSASRLSRRTSLLLPHRGPTYDDVPRLLTNYAEEENSVSAYASSSSGVAIVHSSARSRRASVAQDQSSPKRTNEPSDSADLIAEDSGSALDPSSIPLRVVYSPAVSRISTSGHTSHSPKPSVVSNPGRNSEGTDGEHVLQPGDSPPSSPLLEAPFLSETQVYGQRSSTASNTDARVTTSNAPSLSPQPPSNNGSAATRTSPQEAGDEGDSPQPVFTAFRERKGLRKIVVAKMALGIVTCCVLGNLIYT